MPKITNYQKDSQLKIDFYKLWLKLSEDSILIYNGKDNYILIEKITYQEWNLLKERKEIESIIWCSKDKIKFDCFYDYLKKNINSLEKYNIKELIIYLLNNYNKYFKKSKKYTDKDYILI